MSWQCECGKVNDDATILCDCGTTKYKAAQKQRKSSLSRIPDTGKVAIAEEEKGIVTNSNKKKGVALIVGGFCSFLVLSFVPLYFIQIFYLHYIIALLFVGSGVKFLFAMGGIEEESETLDESQGIVLNRIIRVNLTGGIIGYFSDNAQRKLTKKIQAYNSSNWRVIQVIPDRSGGFLVEFMRFIILIVTLLLYTPLSGYLVIMERQPD